MMTSNAERTAINRVAQRLSTQFHTVDPVVVSQVVWNTHRHFDGHPTRDLVPVLVEDAARDTLRVMTPRLARPRGRA